MNIAIVKLAPPKIGSEASVYPKMLCETICLLFILIGGFCLYDCLKPTDYPPGPKWLPLIGCLHTVHRLRSKHKYVYEAFQELMESYGPLLGLKLGNQKVVVVASHNLVKKLLLQEEFNGRPDGFFFRVRAFGKRKGVLFTDGPVWSQCRMFTMRHLKSFGLGQSAMNDQLAAEAENLVDYFRRASQKGPIPMHNAFDIAVLNSLWCMFAGRKFEYDDEKTTEILATVHEAFRMADTMGGIITQMPFLRFVIPELSGYNNLMRNLEKLWGFLDDEIRNHEENFTGGQPQNLIDAFLLEISSGNKDKNNTIFDRENLLVLCLDLFLAGSKTTTDTLSTIFQYLALHPKWTEIIQNELDSVVGTSRHPILSDYALLPMTKAFLAEAQRYLILAPLGVPHKTLKNVTVNGHRIPKDTIVLFDYHSVHNDSAYWDQPKEFRPQRFLDEKGQFCNNNASIPFGLGKRRCLGEILARSSMFLFFTNVLFYFNIEISPEHGKPDLIGHDGFTISPKPYYLKLVPRDDSNNGTSKTS